MSKFSNISSSLTKKVVNGKFPSVVRSPQSKIKKLAFQFMSSPQSRSASISACRVSPQISNADPPAITVRLTGSVRP